MKRILLHIAVLLVLATSVEAQDVPRVISYQGVLIGADGKPVNAASPINIDISFYSNKIGGAPLTTATYPVTVIGGLFSTLVQIPSNLDLNQQLWMGIKAPNLPEFPRIQLAASLYALNIADNVVTSQKIKNGEVKAEDIGSEEVVKSIKGLKEAIDIIAGNPNIRIKVDGKNIVIEGKDTVKAAEQLIGGVPSGVPIGTIVAYGGETIPDGWLLCNGDQINVAANPEYSALFNAIGTAWGGDASLQLFRLPDIRGRFLRGVDGSANNDPDKARRTAMNTGGNTGNKVGSYQIDAFQQHGHAFNHFVKDAWFGSFGRADWPGAVRSDGEPNPGVGNGDMVNSPKSLKGQGEINFSSETRPKNVYVNYIIKAR